MNLTIPQKNFQLRDQNYSHFATHSAANYRYQDASICSFATFLERRFFTWTQTLQSGAGFTKSF